MKAGFALTCALGFVGGALAVPVAIGSANSTPQSHPSQHAGQERQSLAVRHQTSGRVRAGNAQFVVYDTHCKEYSSTTPAPPNGLNDPRFQPCSPTADTFGIAWLTPPTDAQRQALLATLSDFSKNHPAISFSEGAPLIHAAVDNA